MGVPSSIGSIPGDSIIRSVSLLNSPWLRRVTQPVRARAPRLYAALNTVRKRLIVGARARARELDAYQLLAVQRFRALCRPPAGARILEVGSDVKLAVHAELSRGGAVVTGINLVAGLGPGSVRADAGTLPLVGGAFAFLFRIAAFELIHDPRLALPPLHR